MPRDGHSVGGGWVLQLRVSREHANVCVDIRDVGQACGNESLMFFLAICFKWYSSRQRSDAALPASGMFSASRGFPLYGVRG